MRTTIPPDNALAEMLGYDPIAALASIIDGITTYTNELDEGEFDGFNIFKEESNV